jgi:amino acid adenylation domain-containing protein
MTDLQKRLANLSPKKRALLLKRVRKQKLASARKKKVALPIVQLPRTGNAFPTSFHQERMFVLDKLEGGDAAYHMPLIVRLRGSLSVVALERTIAEIVRRHEVLRTTYLMVDGEVRQIIQEVTVSLPVIDLRDFPEAEKESQVQRLATEELERPFYLESGPPLRATLLQLAMDSHVLLVTIHHIAFDAWSRGIFTRELSALYEAYSQGKASPKATLPIQYADFAHWQRQWLTAERLEKQLNYWKEQLAGAAPRLELPTDQPRLKRSFRGARYSFRVPKALLQKLKAMSAKSGATLFMTLLSAFATLLSRYSGQEDILIGSPITNRNRRELEKLIGFFVNTLVLRTRLEGNPTFSQLLGRVRQMTLDGYAHQDFPFEKLVFELYHALRVEPERHPHHNPLFQVMFSLQNAPKEKLSLPGLSLTTFSKRENVVAKFDLLLIMRETAQGLTGSMKYNADLFSESTIARMVKHFQMLLSGLVANPDQPLANLSLLTEAEREQLLVEWNNSQAPFPAQCVHELFEAQVERTADAVALLFLGQDRERLTYRELNERANQLAHFLIHQGVGPEVLVGLCVERSVLMVVGLLAILKAGAAYLPLDPSYPQERLQFMLSDSGVKVVLTQQKWLSELPEIAEVVCLDKEWPAIAPEGTDNPPARATLCDLAYIIYTSGSTGQPKGVLLEHRGIPNLAQAQIGAFGVQAESRVLQFAPLGFDASVSEIFKTLLAGATLVIPKASEVLAGASLWRLLHEQAITMITLPPSVLATLPNEPLPALETLIVAGEACPPDLVTHWAPNRRFLNAYGPTEATVCATIAEILEAPLSRTSPSGTNGRAPTIGRPIANTQIYLLDRYQNPVPIGLPGELHIGGIGLARGYLNRPQLTAEKFIDNPFAPQGHSSRLYKSGDLARYLPDGKLEFLGRIDHQVKLHGIRIELGEIEAVLNSHPAVRQAVVLVREGEGVPSDKRLVAYFVPSVTVTTSELRGYLSEKLPEKMIPSAFVLLEALPLTPNGKINRRALPAAEWSRESLQQEFVAASNATEEQLTAIWRDVLSVEQVGIHDNFFELGGHSLLATQLLSKISDTFLIELELPRFFEMPTVAGLSKSIKLTQAEPRTVEPLATPAQSRPLASLVAIQPHGDKPPFFCVPGISGNVIYLYQLARSLGNEQPFYALQAIGLDGESEPHTTVEKMAAHYISAIKTVQPEGPYFLGGHSFGGQVAFEMAQQLIKRGHEVTLLALLDSKAPGTSQKRRTASWDETRWLLALATQIERSSGKKLELSYEALLELSAEEQLTDLGERMIQLNLLPPEAGTTRVRGLLRVFKANRQIDYIPQEVIPTLITLLRANGKQDDWGWRKFGAVELYSVPGSHHTMMAKPYVQVLAERLALVLRRHQTSA